MLRLDFSNDLVTYCTDFLGTMTLRETGAADVSLIDCVLSEPVQTKESDLANGQVPQMDQMVVWPVAESEKPALGSVLIDSDDTYWTILAVAHKQHVECWEAKCRNLSVVTAADNVATVLKATYLKGRAGEAKAVWKGAISGETTATSEDEFPARFQPSVEQAKLEFGADTSAEVYRVYFLNTPPIELSGGEFRLVDSSGGRYRVLRYEREERIDKLAVAVCVKITEGKEFWT